MDSSQQEKYGLCKEILEFHKNFAELNALRNKMLANYYQGKISVDEMSKYYLSEDLSVTSTVLYTNARYLMMKVAKFEKIPDKMASSLRDICDNLLNLRKIAISIVDAVREKQLKISDAGHGELIFFPQKLHTCFDTIVDEINRLLTFASKLE